MTYDFTRQDAVDYQLAVWQTHPKMRQLSRNYRKWVWLYAAILTITAPLFFVSLSRTPDHPEGAAIKLAFLGGMAAYAAYWLLQMWRGSQISNLQSHASQAASAEEWDHFLGWHRLTISSSGAILEREGMEFRAEWRQVRRVLRTGPMLLIEFGGSVYGHPVPLRAFTSEELASAFEARANHWLTEARTGDNVRILAYLSNNDGACPRCKYNLRGARSVVCPECGLSITREYLPAAFTSGLIPRV